MKKRLCELVSLAQNDSDCVILAVKPDTQPLDLIGLGAGFYGDEKMLRVSKHPDTVSVTIFRDGERPFTMQIGAGGVTGVSESMRNARQKILECVHLDFGIYTSKHYKGHSFNDLVRQTSGERTLDSERHYELIWGSGPHASLFVNKQHVALIDYDDVDRWMQERNIKRVEDRMSKTDYTAVETGRLERAERTLERPEVFCTVEITRADMREVLQDVEIPVTEENVDTAIAYCKRSLEERLAGDANAHLCTRLWDVRDKLFDRKEPGQAALDSQMAEARAASKAMSEHDGESPVGRTAKNEQER